MTEKSVKIERIKNEAQLKILSISGEVHDFIKEHKVNINAVLVVTKGTILYEEDNVSKELSAGQSTDITAEVVHKVTCVSKAQFLVMMPIQTKMTFV